MILATFIKDIRTGETTTSYHSNHIIFVMRYDIQFLLKPFYLYVKCRIAWMAFPPPALMSPSNPGSRGITTNTLYFFCSLQ